MVLPNRERPMTTVTTKPAVYSGRRARISNPRCASSWWFTTAIQFAAVASWVGTFWYVLK